MDSEHLCRYQTMLSSILHPLGSTGVKDAGKVLKHLQEVFDIKDSQYDLSFLKKNSYDSLELKVEVIEGKKLRSMDPNGLSDPYCTLTILNSNQIDEQGDIKTNQGRNSAETFKTSVKPETLEPVWKEKFKLPLRNVFLDQLVVCVWDRDEEKSVWSNVKSVDRPSGLISLCRQVKNNITNKKFEDDFIGVVAIPLKDIPAEGCDTWWNITTRLKKNSKFAGSIHLRLTLKQDCDQCDSGVCQLDDYYIIVREMTRFAGKLKKDENYFDGILVPESKKAIELFCKQQQIIPTTEKLVDLLTLLEWNSENNMPPVSDETLLKSFSALEQAISSASTWELVNGDNEQTIMFNPIEISLFDQIMSAYIKNLCESDHRLDNCLFPLNLHVLKSELRVLEKLTSLKIDNGLLYYRKELSEHLGLRLKKETHKWLDEHVKPFDKEGRDSVLQDMTDFTMLLVNITKHCTYDDLLSDLPFNDWEFPYQSQVSLAVDEKLIGVCKDLMGLMDQYQHRHRDYHVNIRESSALCHTYYLTLKKLVQVLCRNITTCQANKEESPKQLQLKEYNIWFHDSFLHLLQAFRTECYLRTTRAVELDTKSVMKTDQVDGGQFTNSSVYVLSCFAEVITEWKQLDLEQRELHLAFLVKLTDVICDSTKLYAEMMEQRSRKYCLTQHGQFTIPLQVCTSIGNIDHVWDYVKQLPQKMTWEEVEPDPELRDQTIDVLYKLLNGTEKQLDEIKEKIMNVVLEQIYTVMKKDVNGWLSANSQCKDEHKVLGYLDKNLCFLHQNTRKNVCTSLLPKLWHFVLTEISNGFQKGLKPEYSKVILKNLKAIHEYLTYLGMDSSCQEELHRELNRVIHLHSLSSVELQLEYYEELACNVQTPLEYIGHLAFRAGYREMTKGTVNIIIKVMNAQGLPNQDYSGLSDPFVIVELCPQVMFPSFQPKKTKIQYQTLDPVFNEMFEFCAIPSTILTMKGAVLHFLVMDKDSVSSDFTGEFFVRLSRLSDMSRLTSIDYLPVQVVPLKQYPCSQITFQILEQRLSWDKYAKHFMEERRKLSRNDVPVADCFVKKNLSFCGLFF